MSKKKLFKLDLYNEKTDEVETVEVFKFISWKETKNIAKRAQELDQEDDDMASFDKVPEFILSVLGDCKTSDGKKVTTKVIEDCMSVDDVRRVLEDIMRTISGEDPKALPAELQ